MMGMVIVIMGLGGKKMGEKVYWNRNEQRKYVVGSKICYVCGKICMDEEITVIRARDAKHKGLIYSHFCSKHKTAAKFTNQHDEDMNQAKVIANIKDLPEGTTILNFFS